MSSRNDAVFRVRIVTGAVLLVGLLLVGRLYQLQVIDSDVYLAKGESQYIYTVSDLYDRGSIYFTTRDGEQVSAATVQAGYVMAVNPSKVEDPGRLFDLLEPYLLIDRDTFIRRATLPNRVYVEVRGDLSEEDAAKVEELDQKGVELHRQRWRYYPGNDLAARTVGFVGYEGKSEGEEMVGRYGLERFYEEVLSRSHDRLSVNFFAELFTNLGQMVFSHEEERQGNVVTTIEPTVARLLQNELAKIQERWHSRLTGGIIIDPQTGAIYAMDVVPTFNPNDRGSSTIDRFNNPLVEDRYELGSIIKALTMASGLDSGAVSPSTTYFDAGSVELDGRTFSNYDKVGRGYVDMQTVLNQSLNTGVAFVVQTMGKERFRDYFLKLRLGSETGIDLPGEIHGDVENLNSPRQIEYATASFGQGIAITPIEAARALSALGNGGVLVNPHLASRIEYEDGEVKEILFPTGERVWSEKTSEDITRMLVKVVDEALRNGTVALPEYSIAAKTGTAQLIDPNGGYYSDRFLHSFFGYFPAYDPKFLVFLYTEDPQGVTYASETLTDSFMEIAKFLINYYSIPPDR